MVDRNIPQQDSKVSPLAEKEDAKNDGYDQFYENYGPDSDAFTLRAKKSFSVVLPKKDSPHPEPELLRCNSHSSFQYTNALVPKPKPKKNKAVVSPMKLCRKNFCDNANNSIINDYFPDSVDCNSCPDSEDEEFVLDDGHSFEDTQPFSPIDDSSLSNVRKEMVKFKSSHNVKNVKESNEYENILKIDELINRDEIKPKRKSIFKKHIVKQEENNFIRLSGGLDLIHSNSVCLRNSSTSAMSIHHTIANQMTNYSLLGILESAANEHIGFNLRRSLD